MAKSNNKLSLDRFFELAQDPKTYIIDVRTFDEFRAGHIPGSISVPLDSTYAIWATYLVDPRLGEQMLLVTPAGKEVESITRLARTGLDTVLGFLEGGFEAYSKTGKPVDTTKILQFTNAEEFDAATKGWHLLDIRNPGEWSDGVHPESTLLSMQHAKEAVLGSQEAHKDEHFGIICQGGNRATVIDALFKRNGFKNSHVVKGGFSLMRANQLPVVNPSKPATRTLPAPKA